MGLFNKLVGGASGHVFDEIASADAKSLAMEAGAALHLKSANLFTASEIATTPINWAIGSAAIGATGGAVASPLSGKSVGDGALGGAKAGALMGGAVGGALAFSALRRGRVVGSESIAALKHGATAEELRKVSGFGGMLQDSRLSAAQTGFMKNNPDLGFHAGRFSVDAGEVVQNTFASEVENILRGAQAERRDAIRASAGRSRFDWKRATSVVDNKIAEGSVSQKTVTNVPPVQTATPRAPSYNENVRKQTALLLDSLKQNTPREKTINIGGVNFNNIRQVDAKQKAGHGSFGTVKLKSPTGRFSGK